MCYSKLGSELMILTAELHLVSEISETFQHNINGTRRLLSKEALLEGSGKLECETVFGVRLSSSGDQHSTPASLLIFWINKTFEAWSNPRSLQLPVDFSV